MGDSKLFKRQNTIQDYQLRAFNHGIRVQPDQQILLRPGADVHAGTSLGDLNAADVAPLIFKDVAIYDLVVGASQRRDLFAMLWEYWLPLRDQHLTGEIEPIDLWTSLRGWLGASFNCMGRHETKQWSKEVGLERKERGPHHYYEASVSLVALEWLVTWHESLCVQVRQLVGGTDDDGKEHNVPQDLNLTFKKAFIVLDQEDTEHGGCILCCREEDAASFGLISQARDEVIQGVSVWATWRIALSDAVRAVLQASRRHAAEG